MRRRLALAMAIAMPLIHAESEEKPPELETLVVEGSKQKKFDPEKVGSRRLDAKDIKALTPPNADPNELLEILPNVQFDLRRGRLNADTLADLSPTEVSISGGRPYENNFLIDGVTTNNTLDSLSARSFDNVTASNQSIFIDTDLLSSFELIDSNVSSEYGDFLGGVVKANIRDPKKVFSATLSGTYSTSNWVNYLIRDEDRSIPLPDETSFERQRYGLSLDIPINERVSALLSLTRQEAIVTRGALSSGYFADERPRTTIRDNFLIKTLYDLEEHGQLRFQSLWTPYEDQYYRTNLSRQFGGGTTTKLAWEKPCDNGSLDISLAYTTTDNSREEDPNHFIYANTASIDWVADSRNSALAGGFGDISSSQENLQLDIKRKFELGKNRFILGFQGNYLSASRERPITNFGYRGAQETAGFAISAADLNDGTIIQNEQFLTERNDYRAFSSEAEIIQLNLFAEWQRAYETNSWLTVTPRLGLRYSYDDFLGNHNIAPRMSVILDFPKDVSLTFGVNRYYAKNQLAYRLREQNPDNFVYRRDFTFDGTTFNVNDWGLYRQTRSSSFMNGDLNTPYSDELMAALTTPIGPLGELRIKGIIRKGRDGLARSEAQPTTLINELGEPYTFNTFELTNRGRSEYRSLSLEWRKQWRNHVFTASTTFSENTLSAGTDNFFSNSEFELEDELIYYNGSVQPYRNLDIQRENFNTPFYISFSWVSTWLDDRLTVGFRGRFRDAYTSIRSTNDLVDANGNPGGSFELYEDVELETQFIIDSRITYRHKFDKIGDVEFTLNIDNLFDSHPNVAVSKAQPYQAGRAFSIGAKYRF